MNTPSECSLRFERGPSVNTASECSLRAASNGDDA